MLKQIGYRAAASCVCLSALQVSEMTSVISEMAVFECGTVFQNACFAVVLLNVELLGSVLAALPFLRDPCLEVGWW